MLLVPIAVTFPKNYILIVIVAPRGSKEYQHEEQPKCNK